MSYTYTSKEFEEYPLSDSSSPMESHRLVGGCTFNSLVEHPYKEAFARFGIPAGLVITKGGVPELNMTSLTREMVQKGGSTEVGVVSDSIFDELFHKVSVQKHTRRLTRKNRD